eukprot:6606759-Prymnesium_polylepis.1
MSTPSTSAVSCLSLCLVGLNNAIRSAFMLLLRSLIIDVPAYSPPMFSTGTPHRCTSLNIEVIAIECGSSSSAQIAYCSPRRSPERLPVMVLRVEALTQNSDMCTSSPCTPA